MSVLALSRSPGVWAVAAVLVTLGAVAFTYHKGETAGSTDVTTAVEHTTSLEIEKAREEKDAADEKVRTAAPDAVIDSTR